MSLNLTHFKSNEFELDSTHSPSFDSEFQVIECEKTRPGEDLETTRQTARCLE